MPSLFTSESLHKIDAKVSEAIDSIILDADKKEEEQLKEALKLKKFVKNNKHLFFVYLLQNSKNT